MGDPTFDISVHIRRNETWKRALETYRTNQPAKTQESGIKEEERRCCELPILCRCSPIVAPSPPSCSVRDLVEGLYSGQPDASGTLFSLAPVLIQSARSHSLTSHNINTKVLPSTTTMRVLKCFFAFSVLAVVSESCFPL